MTRKFSTLIRRYPFLIRLPYLLFRRIQPRYTVGVVGVVLNREQQVLIVEHVFHSHQPWGLPGGWVNRNEDPSIAVMRELREELELDILKTQVLIIEKTFHNHLDIAFLCKTDDTVGTISNELLDHQWLKIDNLPDIKNFHRRAIELAFASNQEI